MKMTKKDKEGKIKEREKGKKKKRGRKEKKTVNKQLEIPI